MYICKFTEIWVKCHNFHEFYVNQLQKTLFNLFSRIFREIKFKKSCKSTVWKSAIKSDHDFCAKINIFSVKSTLLLKKLLKSWFDGKFLNVIAFSSTFPHCERFSEKVNLMEFLQKIVGEKICEFPHCVYVRISTVRKEEKLSLT